MNKIIGMDAGTRTRTVTSVVMAVLDVLKVFNIINITDAQTDAIVNLALIIATAVVWAIGFYYNNCHSDENCKYTGLMRAAKEGFEDSPKMEEFDE